MTTVKFLFSGLLRSKDWYFNKYILIYSKVFKQHKIMASPSSSDDIMVIDTLPSPVLIDIDKPPAYKLKKSGLLGSSKVSFKIGRKKNSSISCFSSTDTVFEKYVNNSNQPANSKSAFACKRNVQPLSPIIIDIETAEESDIKKETKTGESDEKLKKINLPLEFFVVDHSPATSNYLKKVSNSISAEQEDPLLIELDISDQDEAGTSASKKIIKDSNLRKSSEARNLRKSKKKKKKKKRESYATTFSDQAEAGTSTSKKTIRSSRILNKKKSKLKKLKEKTIKKIRKFRKSVQTDSDEKRKCVQTDSDEFDVIPVYEVGRSACKGYLSLDVAKDIPIFSSSSDLEKSIIYSQKRNFTSGQSFHGSDSSNFSDSCKELDAIHNSSDSHKELDGSHNSEEEYKYNQEDGINEKESRTIKNSRTDLNDNATSSSIEDCEVFGCNETENPLQNEKNSQSINITNNNEGSDYESEESIDYDAVSMDTDMSDDDIIDIESTNADYIPLSSIKINDLEYCPPISDEILNKRRNFEMQRRWELTGLGNEMFNMNKKQNGSLFTLLSYNVLSQQLILDNIHLYEKCDKRYLEWPYRWPLLQQEVRHLQPDLIAFQEVEGTHYHTHYLPWFKYLGYNCIYKKKTGTKVDGCLIAYNAEKFEVIEENSVEYYQAKGKKHLNRDNVGLIVKFTPTSFYSPFCVATTHLLFNPKRHDVRLAQMAVFLTELDRICYIKEENNVPKYCPVILTGDFNSEPYSPLLRFIRYGSLCYSSTTRGSALLPSTLGVSEYCQHKSLSQGRYLQNLRGELFSLNDKRKIEEALIKISHSEKKGIPHNETDKNKNCERDSGIINHSFKFQSVYYPNLVRLGGEKAVTTHQNHWVTVDYIFYTKILKNEKCVEGDLKLIGRYGLLGKNEAESVGPLPSDICPSDHFPLAAQFFLKRN